MIWLSALLFFAISPFQHLNLDLCLLKNLGFSWCPGCGLGHSIVSLLHGNIRQSFQQHWFGLPAVIILTHRIWILSNNFRKSYSNNKTK
nr:DUF2752 domain-containing protein [Hufsiella arboris]